MSHSRTTLVVASIAAITVLAIGFLTIPHPPKLSIATSGDAELIARVRQLLDETPGVRDRVSVAVIDGTTVREAHFGATENTEYEIGSVTKTMTASLFADAIERADVDPEARLGDIFDLGTSQAASVSLEELATHSSGLPRLAPSTKQLFSAIVANLRASDPYGSSIDELVANARDAQLGEKKFLYSNFGFALLGQALAAAAGEDYSSLLAERVFRPLGMNSSFAPVSAQDLAEDAPTGYTASGRPSDPWTLGGDAPAGSVRSNLADMVRYVIAQRDRTAPGNAATDPRTTAGEGQSIGYAWITSADTTWHNGGTGGFSSWVGFYRDSGRAVVVLNNTAASVDEVGIALMEAS